MLRIVVVGDRDSGRTTFLGLLYIAQVKSGSDRADTFRFHATIDSMEEISALFQRLMSGSFPDAATKEGIHEMNVHLGYRGRGAKLLSRLRSQEWNPEDYATVRFLLPRTLDEDVSRFLKGSSILGDRLRETLEGDAIVILVDSTKLGASANDAEDGTMKQYDTALEAYLTANERWRPRGDRTPLYPIFILSKFDRVNRKVLRAAKVEDSPPPAGRKGPRAAYAEALLRFNLPKTLKRVKARERTGLAFAPPTYFFSWVGTERSSPGRSEKIRLHQTPSSGWEPEYSRDEYLALLEFIWDVAAHSRG